jgi:predicted ATPase
VNRAEFQAAREFSEQLLSLAHRQQDQAQFSEAHYLAGLVSLFLGELSSVQTHTEQGLAFYNPRQYRALGFRTVEDPAVSCHSFAAVALWLMGYPEQALRRMHQAFIAAQDLASSYNLAFALVFAAWLHQFRREGPQVQDRAEAAIALATEQGFPFLAALGTNLRGWAMADQGQEEEGITQLRQGLAAWQAIGAVTLIPYYRALLAEAYGKSGQAEEGRAGIAEALTAVDKTGERFYEAELYRLKGTLTLQSTVRGSEPKVEEAEECFQKAIEIACRQSAKSLELRAVMSLSRLWQQQGKKREAHALLAEIYGWFTEGFETKDLQEAKALLVELS